MKTEKMVEQLLCPGCVVGHDTKCGHYKKPDGYNGCAGHCLGTRILGGPGLIALGMPKGFNRPGIFWDEHGKGDQPHHMTIRLFPQGEAHDGFNMFNVPVWALEHEGFLFVRVAQPRLGIMLVDVIEGAKAAEFCPQAIDVTSKYEEYD